MADYLFDEGKNKIVGLPKTETERLVASLIDDNVSSANTVYSSDKVDTELTDKANKNDLDSLSDAIFNEEYSRELAHTLVENSYVNSLGVISEADGYTRTDYIKVDDYLSLSCDKDAYYCLWDETKTTFIGRELISANVRKNLPSGAVYAILENTTVIFTNAKINGYKTSPVKELSDELNIVKTTANTDNALLNVGTISGKNLYNKNSSEIEEGKSIYYATGEAIDNATVDASGFIEVFEEFGENVIVSGYTGGYAGGGVGMACYDSTKTFVRGSNTNTMSIKGAKYIRLSVRKTDQNTFQCEYGVIATQYEEYTSHTDSVRLALLEANQSKEISRWKNKKVLVLGDSISTDAYLGYASWATQWANKTGAILTNPSVHAVGYLCGVGSSTPDSNSLINLIDTLHTSYPNNDDFDLIVFFRGTNDYGNSITIGNNGDTKDQSFTGAVEYCFGKALDYWSKSQIVVFTPMRRRTEQTTNTVGKVLKDYTDVIAEKSDVMSYPVLDLYNHGGFLPVKNPFGSYQAGNNDFCTQYTMIVGGNPDGLHPNELFTTTRLVPTITEFLESI